MHDQVSWNNENFLHTMTQEWVYTKLLKQLAGREKLFETFWGIQTAAYLRKNVEYEENFLSKLSGDWYAQHPAK